MLQIKINGLIITPMRPDSPEKLFSSEDVPHGTDSCIVKALKVARSNGQNVPNPPSLTEEELAAHKEAFLATVEVLPLFDEDGNAISYPLVKENQIVEFDEVSVKKEFYSNFSEETPEEELTPRMISSNDPEMMQQVQMYSDLAACKVAMTEKAKGEIAQRLLDHAVEECLIVPELSDDFKAQFELIEVEEN